MTRRSLREHTFLLLFQRDFYSIEEMEGQIKLYLSLEDQEKLAKEDKEEIRVPAEQAERKT